MTILVGVTLGAAVTLLLLLIPAIALRAFVQPSVRQPPPRRDQTGRGPVGEAHPRPFGTLRAAS
jgi:hypothetical protein